MADPAQVGHPSGGTWIGRPFIALWRAMQRLAWWRSRPHRANLDPSARMFAGIRRRMTWWYSLVLAIILLVAGVLLYVGMRTELLTPVTQLLQQEARQQAQQWQEHGVPPQCASSPFNHGPSPYFIACYDTTGNLIGSDQLSANYAPDFLSSTLAHTVLGTSSGWTTDTVSGGQTFEMIERYALVVPNPNAPGSLGIIQVGYPIKGEVDALNTLVGLLLAVGALTLLGCGIGGAVLAARTLAPARLAFERQQTFVGDASHELRTPLTLLRADAEVLLRGRDKLDPEDVPLLDDILAETEHLSLLTDRLLTLARLDDGAYHMEQDVVDVYAVLTDVVHRANALAAERHVQILLQPTDAALVVGDPNWLSELLLILLDNAIKYNHAGGSVTLTLAPEGAQAVVRVRDTGPGIPAEHLRRVGERFYRVDKARSRQMGGAGLGLSIARGIAAEHKGTLTLESVPDQGTTVTVRLPLATHNAK